MRQEGTKIRAQLGEQSGIAWSVQLEFSKVFGVGRDFLTGI